MQEFTLQKVSLIIMWLSLSLPGKAKSAKQEKKKNSLDSQHNCPYLCAAKDQKSYGS